MTPHYPLSLIGAASFIAFVLFSIAYRVGRTPAPYRTLARIHLLFSGFYIVCAVLWVRLHPDSPFSWEDAILGFNIYFALQYSFFTHIFATIFRGFSIGILVALLQNQGRATHSKIHADYEYGKGLDYVKSERIEVLIQSDALREEDGRLTLTSFGRFTAVLNQWILKVWNLNYLGKGEVSGGKKS